MSSSRPSHQSRISERERPSPKAKTNLRRLKVSSGSTSTRSSYSDVMTQTESSLSPTSDDGTMDTHGYDGDDTPKRTRHAGLSDSLDVAASLDPATWPVLKDAIGTCFRFSMDRMSMQSVPEGGEDSPQGSLEQALAKTMEQNHELHELCWDILRLAGAAEKSVEASVNHHELVQETRRCIQTFQKLKSQEVPKVATVAAALPVSSAGSPCTAPRSPILKQFRLVSDPSVIASSTPSAAAPSARTISLHSPPQVSRFVSDGVRATSPTRAFSPLRPVWPVPSVPCSPLGRSRSVSVTRRHYRQCWVLEREERFLL